MSKEKHPNNLRLLGSPVNLSYRDKKREDKMKNYKSRPRSAMHNACFTPEAPEKFKRPFSADSKEHVPRTRSFLKTFNDELMQSYDSLNNTKIVAPTTDNLHTRPYEADSYKSPAASDHGSEDTYISLGTKIKARARSPKAKPSNAKNFLKYRNFIKRPKKPDANEGDVKATNYYGMSVKVTPLSDKNLRAERAKSPYPTNYEPYRYDDEEPDVKPSEPSLAGRVSFGDRLFTDEQVEDSIDTYGRRLSRQQLSLVEEEGSQDIDSVESQNASSLSPEVSLEDTRGKDTNAIYNNHDEYAGDNEFSRPNTGLKTYNNFYADFQNSNSSNKMSSTYVATEESLKDSGYNDGGTTDENGSKHNTTLKNDVSKIVPVAKSSIVKSKSLGDASVDGNKDYLNTCPPKKDSNAWVEPVNHSRLLYNDFFLKKADTPLPPQNSPNENKKNKSDQDEIKSGDDWQYPSYLLNSNKKAYTSKVIEDYKKEIEAINNLHNLTLKDIKVSTFTTTSLTVDKTFENNKSNVDNRNCDNVALTETATDNPVQISESNPETNKDPRNIADVSTEELIKNYLKVKDEKYTKDVVKNLKKFDKKVNNIIATKPDKPDNKISANKTWNSKPQTSNAKSASPNKLQTFKTIFTATVPASPRIEMSQIDKDIESWMSLSDPTPMNVNAMYENETMKGDKENAEQVITESKAESSSPQDEEEAKAPAALTSEAPNTKELKSNATVLDIYSMLKEIEGYGENPVPTENVDVKNETQQEEDMQPKDNFLEIFEFLEKVEQSANEALSVVTTAAPQAVPKLEALLRLPATELAQRLVTSSLQLEERSCCIALLQESLASHKEQMINKVGNLERQSGRSIARVKQECEEAIKRHQTFIDQLINDKKTLNRRVEQLVDERRALEERARRAARAQHERHQLELRNQHDKMAAAQQVARQRWVRQKAEKIKELTMKGLEGELRDMAERQQREVAELRARGAAQAARAHAEHARELDDLRRTAQQEMEEALAKERRLGNERLEKQILELEATYREQRTRLVDELRGEGGRAAAALAERDAAMRRDLEKWKEEQEKAIEEKRAQMELEIAKERENIKEEVGRLRDELEAQFAAREEDLRARHAAELRRRAAEAAAQSRLQRDREIEKAIESMEAEAQAGRRELQDALRRNQEQYSSELACLAETERATLQRCREAQARVRETEQCCAELEVAVSQLEARNTVLAEKASAAAAAAAAARAAGAADAERRADALQQQLDEARRTHEEQMHQLYAKVKVAVARKDSLLAAAAREAAKHQERIQRLEAQLQQQRRDFLGRK